MASFDFSNGKHISISDSYSHRVYLNSREALDLLQWLSDRKDELYSFTQGDSNQVPTETLLEIHLYQEDLGHLDELKAAIPDLHERGPIVKVLDAQWDAVSEHALQILRDFQIEYLIHPMLEEHDTYEQG